MQSLLLASHLASQLIGCWAGGAHVELIHQPPQNCNEMRLEIRKDGEQLSLINHGMDCVQGFGLSWDQNNYEVRNDGEVWGGRRTEGVVGWIKPTELYIVDSLNMLNWVEWKGVLQNDLISEQPTLHWQEVMTNGDKNYWTVRSELLPVECDSL